MAHVAGNQPGASSDYSDVRCSQWREAISALADGESSLATSAAVEEHVDRCEDCRAFRAFVEDLSSRLEPKEIDRSSEFTVRMPPTTERDQSAGRADGPPNHHHRVDPSRPVSTRPGGTPPHRLVVPVAGLHCRGCVRTVVDELSSLPGVRVVDVRLDVEGVSRVSLDVERDVADSEIDEALGSTGNFHVQRT